MRNSHQVKIESFYSDNKRMPTYSEMMKLFRLQIKECCISGSGEVGGSGTRGERSFR